jgi:mRNA interferase MazF
VSEPRQPVERGTVWWAALPEPTASEPGFRRPVVVVQADAFNRSRLRTVIAVVLTSNLRLAEAPGNVFVPARESGLPKDSAANVSQVITVDRSFLEEYAGQLPPRRMAAIGAGLRLVLAL